MKHFEEVKPGLFVQQTRKGSWKIVHPIKINGKVNVKHLLIGDWSQFITIVIIIAIILFASIMYKHDMKACGERFAGECYVALRNPCVTKCLQGCGLPTSYVIPTDVNLTWLNQTIEENKIT